MRRLFCVIIILISFSVSAQDFEGLKTKVDTYSKELEAEELACEVQQDFQSKEDQIKAVFYWVASTIKYNMSEAQNPNPKMIRFHYKSDAERLYKLRAIRDSIVQETLTTRKAVCEGYSQTLAKVFNYLDFENHIVKGYVRNSIQDIGKSYTAANHAWNVVKIDNKWVVMDATWAAGAVINGRWQQSFNGYYYDIPRESYFKTHYPEDDRWKFGKKITKKEFYNQPIYTPEFLRTKLRLIPPVSGVIKRVKEKPLVLKIENLSVNQRVLCGLSGYRFAKKPKIHYKNNIAYVEVTPSSRCKKLFLVIDGEVCVEFKLV